MNRKLICSVVTVLVALGAAGCPKKPQYPSCKGDKDCREGEKCKDGKCVQCVVNGDCPSDEECEEGICTKAGDLLGTIKGDTIAAGSVETGLAECSIGAIYFSFDSSELSQEAVDALKKVAECLLAKEVTSITITGHCDPRGTEEYNMGLGLERAGVIRAFLVNYGVPSAHIKIYSKGEEEATGTDEGGWAEDRKGELK